MKKNIDNKIKKEVNEDGNKKRGLLVFFRNYWDCFLTIIIIVICFNVKLPYYIYAPGGTIDISDRIEYAEKKEYDGSLNMLYVREYEANIPTYLLSFVFKNWDLESISKSQISNESMVEIDVRNKIMLNSSINNAKYVAYTEAGKEITVSSKRHMIIGTLTETNLKIGDQILKINDNDIEDLSDIKQVINESAVQDEIRFLVNRNEEEIEVIESVKEIEGVKAIGVIFITDYEYQLSPAIELKFKNSESGSSGGLMMALSIYSAISDEDLLKGRNIAGTGTIDINGNVGEIAGVKYKIMGAVRKGMDVVLVPSANYEEAIKTKKDNNYDIEIVKVEKFSDAIEYLKNQEL